MRTIFFALTYFASYIGAVANLGNHQYPFLFIIIAFGSWVPYILYTRESRRRKRANQRRAYLQEACIRSYLRRNGHYY